MNLLEVSLLSLIYIFFISQKTSLTLLLLCSQCLSQKEGRYHHKNHQNNREHYHWIDLQIYTNSYNDWSCENTQLSYRLNESRTNGLNIHRKRLSQSDNNGEICHSYIRIDLLIMYRIRPNMTA
jgi:hypothetical protein